MAQKGLRGSGGTLAPESHQAITRKIILREQNVMRFDIVKTEAHSVTEISHIWVF